METVHTHERLFALFIHYNLKKEKDWLRVGNEIKLTPSARQKLETDVESLIPILELSDGWHGFAFVFLDPGWTDLLSEHHGFLHGAALGIALERLQSELIDLVRDRPVRLVTAAYLTSLLDVLETNTPETRAGFERLLLGHRDRLQYDSAKVVEAVIRIANFSRNVPILRFDDDVLFKNPGPLANARPGILRLCTRFDRLVNHPKHHYFIFSGCYLEESHEKEFILKSPASKVSLADGGLGAEQQQVDDAINSFATRVLQLAELPNLEAIASLPSDDLMAVTPDLDLAKVSHFLGELCEVGANPFGQVISGAGLCLSDSAILDLPPFSNMRENVVWIDDHLKFSLHRELRHFGLPPAPEVGRVRAACFRQDRSDPKRLSLVDVQWHTSQYLPRLLRGCVVDHWLCSEVRLKCSEHHLTPDDWAVIGEEAQAPGTFTHYFVESLAQGRSGSRDRRMREALWQGALERLRRIVKQWGDIKVYRGTFLHFAVQGPGPGYERLQELGFLPPLFPAGLAAAVAELPDHWPARHGRSALAKGLCELVDDLMNYVELVRFWKHFVQSTRFELNTPIDRSQVFWAFPTEYPP